MKTAAQQALLATTDMRH